MASLRRIATRLPRGVFGTVVGTVLSVTPALAEFPGPPVTLIMPWEAGRGTDQAARPLAMATEQILGQPLVMLKELGYPYLRSVQAVIDAAGIPAERVKKVVEDGITKAEQFLAK